MTAIHLDPDVVRIRRVDSPIGRIELVGDGEYITGLSIERDGHLPHDGLAADDDALLDEAARQLGEYFDGSRTSFDLPIRYVSGTAFQRSVWNQLEQLEWGQYTSYGELGEAVGRPHAGRAIGGAVGANPIPLIVGCHRVLASNRHITGYSGGEGIPTKIWLLDHENIVHKGAASVPALFEIAAAS